MPSAARGDTGVVQLLVSVASAAEARVAIDGGADIVDAKDPASGALGAVDLDTLRAICVSVGGQRPVSAALGDAIDDDAVMSLSRDVASTGVAFVKIGLAAETVPARVRPLIAAAVRGVDSAGAGPCGVVAVAYADQCRRDLADAREIAAIAAGAGASGVLIDTVDKAGPGLLRLVPVAAVASWVEAVHRHHLFAAVAGRLTPDDAIALRETGADIVGVRGAACDGGRQGRVSSARVHALRDALDSSRL